MAKELDILRKRDSERETKAREMAHELESLRKRDGERTIQNETQAREIANELDNLRKRDGQRAAQNEEFKGQFAEMRKENFQGMVDEVKQEVKDIKD